MINLYERMLPTSTGVEPVTSWSPVGRRIQLSHRGRQVVLLEYPQRANELFYNVASTSMQRHDVASTLIRRCLNGGSILALAVYLPHINHFLSLGGKYEKQREKMNIMPSASIEVSDQPVQPHSLISEYSLSAMSCPIATECLCFLGTHVTTVLSTSFRKTFLYPAFYSELKKKMFCD